MTESPKIAAVVLTKDEEVNIANCLKSLSWVDELVVCDTGSRDGTLRIARDFGANVFEYIPDGEFIVGEVRNWTVENCVKNTDWVLFIDADEVVTGQLKNEILEKIKSPGDKVGFKLCPKFMFMGKWLKHTMKFPSWHDRLGLREMIHCPESDMLDHFDCPSEKMGFIYSPYLHYALNKGITEWVSKHNRYSSHLANRLDKAGEKKIDWEGLFKINDPDPKRWRRAIESLFSRFPALYPFGQFIYMYILKCGFLDGFPGLVYSLMLLQYNMVVWFKTIELKRRRDNLPL